MWVACTPPCSLKCYLLVTHETFRNPSPHYMEINDTAVRKQSHRICPGPLFPYISINQFICAEKGLRAVKISPSPHFFAARIFPPLFFGLAFPFAWNLATATIYDTLPHCHTWPPHFITHLSPFFAALSAAAAKLIFTPSSPACPGGRKEVFVLCWCVLYLIIDASMIIILTLARRVQPFVWNHIKIRTSAYFVLSRPSWHFYCRRCSKARLVQRCPKACRRWHWPGVPGAD